MADGRDGEEAEEHAEHARQELHARSGWRRPAGGDEKLYTEIASGSAVAHPTGRLLLVDAVGEADHRLIEPVGLRARRPACPGVIAMPSLNALSSMVGISTSPTTTASRSPSGAVGSADGMGSPMPRSRRSAVFGPSATSRGPDGMRPRTTVNDGAPSSACIETPVMRSPPASTWPKWMIPTSSTPSTARSSLASSSATSGARVQFHPLLRRVLHQGVEAGAEGHGRDDPRHAERRADDRRPDGDRRSDPRLGRGPSRPRAGSDGANRPLASRDAAGRRGVGADPARPIRVARRAPKAALAPSRSTSSSAPIPSTSRSTSMPGVGLGPPRLADRHRRASPPIASTTASPAPVTMTGSDREDHGDRALGAAQAHRAQARARRPPSRPCDGAGPGRRRRARRARPPARRPPTRRPAPSSRPPPSRPGRSAR